MSTPEVTAGLLEPFDYGRGYLERVGLADPGAGNPAIYKVAGGFYARVLSVVAQLVTSAVAGSRTVEFRVTDSDGTVWDRFGAGVLVPPSTTLQIAGSDQRGDSEWCSDATISTALYIPTPGRFLQPTEQYRLVIGGMDVGDVISGMRLTVERFPEGRRGYREGRVYTPTVEPN